MSEATQKPPTSSLDETAELFNQGMKLGRAWAEQAVSGLQRWAQKNPEQVVLAGLAVGFVLGKVLLKPRLAPR
jgi:hypothetical protein